MKEFILSFLVAVVSIAPLVASATTPQQPTVPGQEGHGGNVVVCTGKEPVVIDYYQAALTTFGGQKPDLVDISKMSKDEVIKLVTDRIHDFAQFSEQTQSVFKKLGPIESWPATDLRQVDDSNEPYILPPGCVRKTAAVRQGIGDTTAMFVDPAVAGQLSPAQIGILSLHEVFYYIASLSGQVTSENVRILMRAVLQRVPVVDDISTAIKSLGGDGTYVPQLADGLYRGLTVSSSNPSQNRWFGYSLKYVGQAQVHLDYAASSPDGYKIYIGSDFPPALKSLDFQCSHWGDCTLVGTNVCNPKLVIGAYPVNDRSVNPDLTARYVWIGSDCFLNHDYYRLHVLNF